MKVMSTQIGDSFEGGKDFLTVFFTVPFSDVCKITLIEIKIIE